MTQRYCIEFFLSCCVMELHIETFVDHFPGFLVDYSNLDLFYQLCEGLTLILPLNMLPSGYIVVSEK